MVQQRSQEGDSRNSRLTNYLSIAKRHLPREGSEKQVRQDKGAGDMPDSKRCIIWRHLVT